MKRPSLLVFATLLMSNIVWAADRSGWYTRVAVNRTNFDFSEQVPVRVSDIPGGNVPLQATLRSDETATGFDVGFGYRFSPYFGLELGYSDLGEHRIVLDCDGEPACNDFATRFEIEPRVVSLLGTLSYPLSDRFEVHALVGAASIEADASFGELDFTEGSSTSTDLKAGLGATWSFNDKLGLDLRYSRIVFDDLDDFEIFELGLRHAF